MPLAPGVHLDRYEIRSRLGAGGMGEVYLAQDTRLGRAVALKLLLPELSFSREHLRRFEQEARAASALNHPNILTIYEVGSVDSIGFIAMEYVDGVTLRRHISANQRLTVAEAIQVTTQIASGLAAAHEAGIVHRDVKPENIMIRKDGYVKVLDFGLAKLTENPAFPSTINGESTISEAFTHSGTVLGTVSYMSPEQLRGRPVDARTDIWSTGCVLYEMIAGRIPFAGASRADLIVSILEREHAPLSREITPLASELELILTRTLAKERSRRYQSTIDLLLDLRDLEAKSSDSRSTRHGIPRAPQIRISPGSERPAGEGESVRPVARQTTRQRVSTVSASRNTLIVLTMVVVLALLAGGAYLGLQLRKGRPEIPRFRATLQTKLVDTGNAVDAVISPDGKYIAYVIEESGGQSLWGRQAGTVSNAWPIVRQSDLRISGLTFSTDGNFVFYVVFDQKLNQYVLYRIPALGGVSDKLLEDVDTPITFSPGGKQFAFVRGYPAENRTAIVLFEENGKGERVLASRQSPDDFGWKGGPSWSADGELIACAVGRYDTAMSLVAVRVKDGSEIKLSSKTWPWIGRVSWVDGGAGLLVVAKELQSSPPQIWHVSYPSGEATQISSDLSAYSGKGLSTTADSAYFVAIQNNYLSSIWLTPRGASDTAKRLTPTKSDGYHGLSWTPDGKIVFASSASGNQDLWIMDSDGTNRRQLTSGAGANYQPAVTPDGHYVVFASTRSGSQDLWRLNLTRGDLTQLTSGSAADWPQCSPDGRWVVYKSYASGKKTIWKVGIDGGQPTQLTDKYSDWPAVSPDGKYIACEYWDELPTTQAVLALVPFSGGSPVKSFSFPPVTATSLNLPTNVVRWTMRGSALTYIDGQTSVSNIMEQPIEGGAPRFLSHFNSDRIFWFDWSPDGTTAACARGAVTSDVVLFARDR